MRSDAQEEMLMAVIKVLSIYYMEFILKTDGFIGIIIFCVAVV